MRGKLAGKYSSLFDNRGAKKVPYFALKSALFLREAYKNEKLAELASFAVWELFHKCGFFSKNGYLEFNNSEALALEKESVDDLDSSQTITDFCKSRGLRLVRSNQEWKLLFINDNNKEICGCLYADDKTLYKSSDNGKSIICLKRFPAPIKSIFISSRNTLFVCIKGAVYRSSDNGNSFKKILVLGSSESYFRRNYGMAETASKSLIIGEYGNIWDNNCWRRLAYLYFSCDDGETWETSDFLVRQGTNKHVHVVWYSKLLNKIIMTDGDNKKKLWVSDELDSGHLKDVNWNLANRFHIQMGGHTSIVETDGRILLGTDYMGGTNCIIESTDCENFRKRIIPDPYRKSPIMKLLQRKSKKGNEIWALLPYSSSGSKSLLMYTVNSGKSWGKVIEYRGSNHGIQLISSSNGIPEALYLSARDVKKNNRAVYKIVDN